MEALCHRMDSEQKDIYLAKRLSPFAIGTGALYILLCTYLFSLPIGIQGRPYHRRQISGLASIKIYLFMYIICLSFFINTKHLKVLTNSSAVLKNIDVFNGQIRQTFQMLSRTFELDWFHTGASKSASWLDFA